MTRVTFDRFNLPRKKKIITNGFGYREMHKKNKTSFFEKKKMFDQAREQDINNPWKGEGTKKYL